MYSWSKALLVTANSNRFSFNNSKYFNNSNNSEGAFPRPRGHYDDFYYDDFCSFHDL